jgi:hypothetical protein
MSAISQLKQASFDGIAFPYTTCEVMLETRRHVHLYIHTNGGELEKLGLAFEQACDTDSTIIGYAEKE